jgi:hypothetical protein
MKNIHIIPTDKLTGIFELNNGLHFSITNKVRHGVHKGYHIYITSNEDPKNKDYYWDENKLKVKRYFESRESFPSLLHRFKVILTTDPELIADGVQAIDDEFIQWFVKNPRCEEVKLEKEHDDTVPYLKMRYIKPYRILSEYKKHSLSLPDEWAKIAYKIYKSISKSPSYKKSPIKLTKMEETLEQYIERLKDRRTEDDYPYTDEDFIDYMEHIEDSHKNNLSVYKCLEFMYFAERKSEQVKDITYWKNNAEEDLREAFGQGWMTRERFDDLSPEIVYPDGLDYEEKQEYAFNLWFNQFKKK